MNENTRTVIQATFEASNKGQIHFGDVIAQLIGVEVEAYHVDYRSGRTTYDLREGAALDFGLEQPQEPISEAFDRCRSLLGPPEKSERLGAGGDPVSLPGRVCGAPAVSPDTARHVSPPADRAR